MKFKLSSWLKHPSYFFFWFFLGLVGWSFSFSSLDSHPTPEQSNFSSVAPVPSLGNAIAAEEVHAMSEHVSSPSEDEAFYQELKRLEIETLSPNIEEEYALTPEEIESYQQNSDGTLNVDRAELQSYLESKKKFRYEDVSADDLNYFVTPEDANQCGDARNYIEKAISKNSKLGNWAAERPQESKKLSRKCIAFVMNSFPEMTLKKDAISFKTKTSPTFAKCPNGASGGPALAHGVRTKNPIPCVSKNLVNLTYNAYTDVMTCLKIEPKDLLPKIYNESGFFLNALGGGMDGGIGQLTKPAIDQVNSIFPKYIEEMTKAAAAEPDGPCARILKNKALIMPAHSDSGSRCGLLWPAENPLKNILYIGILTRYNMKYVSGVSFEAGNEVIADGKNTYPYTGTASDQLAGKFKEYDIRKKLDQLGFKSANMNSIQKMITLVGYNSGIGSAMTVFNNYLDQRIAANQRSKTSKYNLKPSDFDFIATKDAVKQARDYITSSFIKPGDPQKSDKVKKRSQLPAVWGSAFTKTFPEYIVLKLNSYKGDSSAKYQIYGFPGYLSALAEKNKMIRDTFQGGGVDPEYCSSSKFLNFKD